MYDVIVVGARCAGAPTAMLLARNGLRVLLLDREDFPSEMTQSTHLIHARGVALLRKWGLLGAVESMECLPVRSGRLDFGAFALSADFPAVDGVAEAYAPRRIFLDTALIRAAERAGAELRTGCTVREVLFEDGRPSGVRGEGSGGKSFAESARFVVGADGPSSLVARAVGAREYDSRPALQGTAWSYWSGVDFEPGMRLYLGDYEAIYAFPTSGGQLLVGTNWAIDGFKIARQDAERSYLTTLGRLAPALREALRAGRQEDRLYLGSTRNFLRCPAGRGWALVGDAGYKKDPCTAQGITDAFLDAERLSAALESVFGGSESEEDVLSRFHRERDDWSRPFYELTCELARFAPPPPETVALYQALRSKPEDTRAFLGLVTEATRPAEFFAPENLQRILGGAPHQTEPGRRAGASARPSQT